ncbi:STOREKEEPER protein-like [Prosopis cineraria]|uniref:STOREKEEPER protein-like n=1 Tax=Prosopis cineraria TaxID=364024 RepID=UPI00240F3028|nr:STOREKEEPER protein-like [Prosopis cineraria]XP_054816045.1 STOREKEEPER protein-like [Prosopis cineraria]
MARKRRLQDPPPLPPAAAAAASSTEDEVEESASDAVEEEANGVSDGIEREDEKSEGNAEDESVEESETESDKTQPSPSVSDFTIKPIVSKPISDSAKHLKHAANNDSAPVPATIVAAGGSKRANDSNTEKKESKKKKLSESQDEDVKKEPGVQRLWNEDDEIAILKGMIDYHSKRGVDPCSEMSLFHEYMKNKIHADVSKAQLVNKIRSLKRKFQTNAKKGENGEDPVFSKPCYHEIFELSKKVWESEAANGVDQRKPGQSKGKNSSTLGSPKRDMVEDKYEPHGDVNAMPAKSFSKSSLLGGFLVSGKLSLPESAMDIVKEAMPLIGSSKANELERRGKELQKDEFLLYLRGSN